MKKLKLIFGLAILIFSVNSCDKVEFPLEKGNSGGLPIDTTGSDTTNYTSYSDTSLSIRKLLLEEFTGHACPNCPAAATIANQLKQTYGDTLILVGIHASGFANPNNPNSNYSTDFRTTAGNEYNTFWGVGVAGLPKGFVSRSKIISNNIIIPKDSWGSAISTLKNGSADAKLEIGLIYDSSTRTVTTFAKATALNQLNDSYKLMVYLTEDNIVDWQLDGSTHINNYNHRHVLRDAISGTWGEELIPAGTSAGTIRTKTYSNYVINSNWKVSDCTIVAYIYNSTTYEIIQAEEVHIVP